MGPPPNSFEVVKLWIQCAMHFFNKGSESEEEICQHNVMHRFSRLDIMIVLWLVSRFCQRSTSSKSKIRVGGDPECFPQFPLDCVLGCFQTVSSQVCYISLHQAKSKIRYHAPTYKLHNFYNESVTRLLHDVRKTLNATTLAQKQHSRANPPAHEGVSGLHLLTKVVKV